MTEMFTYADYLAYQKIKEKEARENSNCANYLYENTEPYNCLDNQKQHPVNHEHDKIFRKMLEDKKEVVKLINKTLNLNNKQKINPEDIEKYTSSFVSQELKNQESDIIYKLKDRNIFFLIEHQTKIDYSMPIRILEYEYEIIKSAIDYKKIKRKAYKIPAVTAIVVYSGDKPWNVERYIEDKQEKLIENEKVKLAKYYVVDVNNFSKEELLKDESLLSKIMLIEKTRKTNELVKYLEEIVKEMNSKKEVYTKEQKDLLITILDLTMKRKIGDDKTEELIKKLRVKEGENMLAVLDMIDRENRNLIRKGEKRGIKKGKLEDAKNMLKKEIDIGTIIEITGLTKEEITSLNI